MKKKNIIIAAVVAIVIAVMLVVGYVNKGSAPADEPQPEPTVSSSTEPVNEEDDLVPIVIPVDVWEEDEDTGYNGFTTLAQLGEVEDSIGVLTIEKISVSCHVYDSDENTVMADMTRGAAHFKISSYWDGNVAFSAHIGNREYCYFDRLHELVEGDIITYETALGQRNYAVQQISRISDEDWSMIERTADNRVTLVTCIEGQPDMRLCVQAVEVAG